MSYNLGTYYVNAKINAEDAAEAYRAASELIQYDEVAHCDSWFGYTDMSLSEDEWGISDVLEMIGFTTRKGEDGSIIIVGFNDDSGEEYEFFKVLAPWIVPATDEDEHAVMKWYTEFDTEFHWVFKNGSLICVFEDGTIVE